MPADPTRTTVTLHPSDNVVVVVDGDDDRRGHKLASRPIAAGEAIVKLGEIIGAATEPIAAGDHVHTHNVAPNREPVNADDAGTHLIAPPAVTPRTFEGFVRPDGRVGTRNHLLVLTSVNCSASVAKVIAARARESGLGADVDGITALTHHGGCALGQDSEGLANLRRTLAGYATHPNVGGVLILGLGCESNQVDGLLDTHGLEPGDRLRTLVIQDEGGSAATVDAGLHALAELAESAATDRRSTVPVSHLALALQCGGSDGYSAITANPALGRAADLLVGHGGTAVLGETPEMHGAEHLLVRRAVDRDIAQLLLDRLAWWREHNEPEHNPSPGNKKGGLTTIAEKSLGAVAKGGTTPLVDVLRYAEPLRRPGFVIMDSPGYDPCSVTGEIASGCTICCFTTGRGSVSGFAPSPSLKVSTNTALYERMTGDIDLDAGPIATGDETVDEVGGRLFDLLVDTASGRATKSEALGFGEEEFVPWQMGVVT
ncbi:MAG: altronate dehydratase family protein [Acidimicrobiales bacterium]|nr:altronate dehydratase family protein [Acidimicrobiales bacterium]